MPKNAQQLRVRGLRVEMPGARVRRPGSARDEVRPGVVVGEQHFGRREARQFRSERFGLADFAEQEAAAGEIDPGQAEARVPPGGAAMPSSRLSRRSSSSASSVTVPGVTTRTTLRSTRPLASAGSPICSQIATDSPSRTSFAEIAFDRVIRHAGHRNRRAGRRAALRQRDVEQARGLARVVVEQLVEIAHAKEQQRVRILRLGGEVLAHQRRVLGEVVAVHAAEERCSKHEPL